MSISLLHFKEQQIRITKCTSKLSNSIKKSDININVCNALDCQTSLSSWDKQILLTGFCMIQTIIHWIERKDSKDNFT